MVGLLSALTAQLSTWLNIFSIYLFIFAITFKPSCLLRDREPPWSNLKKQVITVKIRLFVIKLPSRFLSLNSSQYDWMPRKPTRHRSKTMWILYTWLVTGSSLLVASTTASLIQQVPIIQGRLIGGLALWPFFAISYLTRKWAGRGRPFPLRF